MSELVFRLPNADTPGFLRRQRIAIALQSELADKPTVASIDRLAEFLVTFVAEPADRQEALGLIWELPQSQLEETLRAITESQADPKASGPQGTGLAATAK